jgi:serine/threonine protein kinase
MARHWICPSGHGGSGELALPVCPECGLPIEAAAEAANGGAPDETLVGASGQVLAPRNHSAVQDLVFLDGPESGGDTLVPPEKPPTRPLPGDGPATAPAWAPFPEAASPDETLQKSSTSDSPSRPPVSGHSGPNGPPTTAFSEEPLSSPHGETLVKPSTAPAVAEEKPGVAIVSGYEILGVLGRGGMGVVYKARQLGLNRIVALKMILHGGHASPTDLMRFKIEAEAVAALQHPNIVQIHEIGEREGRPFFSLEFCGGGSLQQRLDREPQQPTVAATLIERLARAVDSAHRRGIVHRDLKPANILIAEPPTTPLERCTLKITDFGLAKRLQDEQQQTRSLDILGTPAYMAPEQAHGSKDVGPLADVYALGAILYDLLTGQPPFKGNTVLDTLDLVRKAEPVPPARLRPNCPRDLQTICLKCLQKDPAKRYASALDLADDLRRFLEGRPIEARPTPGYERAWKWARRRPAAAALLVLALLAPLVVTAVSVRAAVTVNRKNVELTEAYQDLEAAQDDLKDKNAELADKNTALEDREKKLKVALAAEEKERRRANQEREKALQQEKDAQDSFLQAQKAVEDLLSLAQQRLRNEPGTEKVRRALLQDAVRMCQHFTDKPSATPASRYRAARAHRLMADMQAELKDNCAAERNYRKSLALYDQLQRLPRQPGAPDYASEAIGTAMQLWSLLEGIDQGRAEKELSAVLHRLEEMPGERAEQPLQRRNRAVVLANQAIHYQNRGQLDQAEADYERAARELAGLKGVKGVELERARLDINRATLWLARGSSWDAQKRRDSLEKALQASERAVRVLERLLEKGPGDTAAANELGRACNNLGLVWLSRDDLNEAARVYDRAVEIFERLHQGHRDIVDYRHLLAVALGNQGLHLLREHLPQRAREPLLRGRDMLQGLVKGFPDVPVYREDLARLCNGLALAYLRGGQTVRAEALLETAAEHLEKAFADNPKREGLRQELLAVYQNQMVCHDPPARAAAARKDWIRAEPHVRALVKARQRQRELLVALPASAPWPERTRRWLEQVLIQAALAETLWAHAGVHVELGEHREAVQEIERIDGLVAASCPRWEKVARLLCRCIRLARKDDSLSADEKARLVERYGQRALTILEGLVGRVPGLAGEIDRADFEPLRQEPALQARFRRLAQRLRK